MNEFITVKDLPAILAADRVLPTITMWNRLEGRPRTEDFRRALRAEVRDPLWMLCKQWQVGEFRGDDAGSPVSAKVHVHTTRMTRYRPGAAAAEAFDDGRPLEATVERRPVGASGREGPVDLRLLMGRRWLKQLGGAGLQAHAAEFVARYAFVEPDPASRDDAPLTAHAPVWQRLAALAGRAMDGWRLYEHLTADPAHRAYDGTTVPDADKPAIDELATAFVAWFDGLYEQPSPAGDDAWQPSRLEYAFAVSARQDGQEKVMVADEYHQGRLDWYSLDVDRDAAGLEDSAAPPPALEASVTHSFLPVNVQFDGMPNTRWWTFEEGRTNFGAITPDTTDLNKLLLMEFGLVYANDWCLLPLTLDVGSLARIEGLAVTNVFGERIWVRPAGAGADEDWQRWAMYGLAVRGDEDVAADTTLVLLPTVPKLDEGEPLQDVALIRDEVSNMVWAVEQQIPLATGRPRRGREAATELLSRYTAILDGEIEGGLVIPDVPVPAADIRYELMHGVPENWIPFIPVHVDGDEREIQLQRASMPRIIEGDPTPPRKVKPRTGLMRHGLDQAPPQAYYLHEEEVPRAGVRVTQAYQRTRWHDGRVYTWLGVRKQTGRGEGHSGLAFDRIPTTKARPRPALRRTPDPG